MFDIEFLSVLISYQTICTVVNPLKTSPDYTRAGGSMGNVCYSKIKSSSMSSVKVHCAHVYDDINIERLNEISEIDKCEQIKQCLDWGYKLSKYCIHQLWGKKVIECTCFKQYESTDLFESGWVPPMQLEDQMTWKFTLQLISQCLRCKACKVLSIEN